MGWWIVVGMIHLALQVASFLFLAAVGIAALALIAPVAIWLLGLPFRLFLWANGAMVAWSARHPAVDAVVSAVSGGRRREAEKRR